MRKYLNLSIKPSQFNYFNNNKMNLNDSQDQSYHLLKWINNERLHQGQPFPLITLEEIPQTTTLELILLHISPTHFTQLNIQQNSYLQQIQSYLDKEHGKRMRFSYKHSLSNLNQLIKLACYFCTKCPDRNSYINRIFNLPPSTQQFLMEELQRIEGELENIVEIKEILCRVQCIQEENDTLREKLHDITETNMRLMSLYDELQQQQHVTKYNLDKMQKQKEETLSVLGITNMKEYIQLYKQTKQQNKELINLIQVGQQRQKIAEQNLNFMNKRIHGDTMVISQLNDELNKYKELYHNMKEENHLNEMYSSNILAEAHINRKKNGLFRSGMSYNKENMKASLMKSVQTNNNSYSLLSEEDDDYEKLRKYNKQLMIKLEDMYTKYNKLNEEQSQVRERNSKLEKENAFYSKKCQSIRFAQDQFMRRYMKTVSMKK